MRGGVAVTILVLGLSVLGQDKRIPMLVLVDSQNSDPVTAQLGDDLKETILASGRYRLVSDRKQAEVSIDVMGIGIIVGNNAAVSELVCLHPAEEDANTAVYHTIAVVGSLRTHLIADQWFTASDQLIKRYLKEK
jgi:hypothetical protein